MKIEKIELHHIEMELKHPFKTSFSTQTKRPCIIVTAHSAGLTGWGECVAGEGPYYSSETIATSWIILKDFLIPRLIGQKLAHPSDVVERLKQVRGNEMAKAALENAVWDLFAKQKGVSLKEMIGGVYDKVKVGVSIGIQPSLDALLERVSEFVDEGYDRIKIKIKKGLEFEAMSTVRAAFPDISLMADANSDYELTDTKMLQRLDSLKLIMIEQPLRHYDIIDHAKLQHDLKTPICLDESIHCPDNARHAIKLKACRIINIKIGRVGGLTNAIKIHDIANKANIPVWCGGMLETGIGRATNLALASLSNFTLPGDISATDRYYNKDITSKFSLNKSNSTIQVPSLPGIGLEVDEDYLKKLCLHHYTT